MRQIAFYGKGGIGKSTTAANVSAALADMGIKVMQIGCDPKHDSTRNLVGGRWLPTMLEIIRKAGGNTSQIELQDIMFSGYKNVQCIEVGGPEPGVGCGGRGIILAMELLTELEAFERVGPDIVVYDVLGDVVCGGFAMPLREGYAQETYIITSGELMALYAANNICRGIARFAARSHTRLAGVICNGRRVDREEAIVASFAEQIGSNMLIYLPQDEIVRKCELAGQTVIEGASESGQAEKYRQLTRYIVDGVDLTTPQALELDELVAMVEALRMQGQTGTEGGGT